MLFALMGVLWGIPYLMIKVAVESVSVPMVVFTRTALGALVLLPLVIRSGQLGTVRRHWRPLLAFTAVEILGPWALLSDADSGTLAVLEPLLTLGLHHEQQHQELMVTDLKYNFFENPLCPVYRPRRDAVIRTVNEECDGVVFILWGAYAQKKAAFVDEERHLVIKSAHPSPLSAHNGFLGSKPFSKANEYLQSIGKDPVDWQLPETV